MSQLQDGQIGQTILAYLKLNFSYEEKHLEPSISKWWASQEYKVAWGEGLFKHVDYDKWSPKE
jgi:hypothetical protein